MINVAENVNFVLGGGSGTLTIKGNSSLTQNIIYSKGNVTLKDNLVINNSYASNGVIYVYAGSLKMEGGEISNNQSNAITSNMGGGNVTIDIYGGKIYNNTKNSSYHGSAIYIISSSYYAATVNIYGEAQIFRNNNSSGAAIKLNDADSVLYINSSDSENSAEIYDNTTTNIQIDAGQLFINNTEIDLFNYTDSNII